ncbi:hypothetical protein HG530_014609 [Fusarium avenaceum]|nr:hypothetical protein HG530_014609 [Fusarium avenaceum]
MDSVSPSSESQNLDLADRWACDILMAGAHACTHPLVANDRHAVQNRRFRRANMLYHIRHESDRIHLLQANGTGQRQRVLGIDHDRSAGEDDDPDG